MADQSTFDRVCAIVREQGGLDDVELTRDTTLAEVGLDSLATVEAVMACEDEFGIEIDAESNPTPSVTFSVSRSPSSRAGWRGSPTQASPLPSPRPAASASSRP